MSCVAFSVAHIVNVPAGKTEVHIQYLLLYFMGVFDGIELCQCDVLRREGVASDVTDAADGHRRG